MKKQFNKNLIMFEEEEKQLQSSNTCWICKTLIDDEKVRDYCHITENLDVQLTGVVINLQLTKNSSCNVS